MKNVNVATRHVNRKTRTTPSQKDNEISVLASVGEICVVVAVVAVVSGPANDKVVRVAVFGLQDISVCKQPECIQCEPADVTSGTSWSGLAM